MTADSTSTNTTTVLTPSENTNNDESSDNSSCGLIDKASVMEFTQINH